MKVFDLKEMKCFPYEEREKNVFYKADKFKMRIIELPPGGIIPSCEMSSHVIFSVLDGSAEVQVDQEKAAIREGHCLVTVPATVSMNTEEGVRIMGIQIERE